MNLKSVFKLLSHISLFIGILILIPTLIAFTHNETEAFKAFLYTELMIAVFALIILIATHTEKNITFSIKDSYLVVTFTWIIATLFGALPFYFSGMTKNYSAAFFETMSGFTTTGATCLVDIESNPISLLFWRNMTNWLGGMGIVVLFVALLPACGVKGTALVGAESVGPTKDKLTPQIQGTAMALWGIYIALSILQTILLLLGGLNWFDATTITFGTLGAAGFVPKNASIAAYQSPYVEWICIIFMFLAGANFALYFKLLQKKILRVLKDGELKLYTQIVVIFSLLITLNLWLSGYNNFADSLRLAAFQVVSFITTTGFSTTNYSVWPMFSQMLLFTLMFIGGCAGSAGGGIKVIRIKTMMKMAANALTRRIHPNAVTKIRVGEDTISTDTAISIAGFIGVYIATALIGTIIISLSEKDFLTCFTGTLLCLGNIGIGIGTIGTTLTFDQFSPPYLWIFSFLMLVGRLELFTVYSLFTRKFWAR